MSLGLYVVVGAAAVAYALTLLCTPTYLVHERGVVLVTGASSGIGRDAALHLAAKGYDVFAGVRKERDAQDLRETDKTERLHPVILDVTKEAHQDAVLEKVVQHMQRSNLPFVGLVNNAGVGGTGPVEYTDMDTFRWVMEVNFFGVVGLTKKFIPLALENQGRIVSVSSVAGRLAWEFFGAYTSSKFALEAFSDSLRRELFYQGVSVSLIEPGFVMTPIFEKNNAAVDESFDHIPEDALVRYGAAKVRDSFNKGVELADSTQVTSDVIYHSLNSPNPRSRYLCANIQGIPSSVAVPIFEALPKAISDKLFYYMNRM
mmetsp:Transcript_8990/g.25171  ORF Transcript_8990/g.25171 Transcript_8990/m.25171 type:complete len:316 (+) Transcript_8990:82-1029(+)|eukprot:CAMPEP_0119121160 /NCGR_PEP_ID=MMETSP1310-20130426/1915_1 /TAXON_ID=464262 /ORGANISM="Genus nov. species nov., Strain RCC2339" /LENGTH=315 /DNA_ID=CAMNT_0007110705 /DNA_START=84 /DNA_END=1031 /DNA_ORIENTATION=-